MWLYDAASLNKLSQSVLEMLRGGIQDLAVDVTVFYTADADLDDVFMQPLPIALRNLRSGSMPPGKAFVQALAEREFDYAALFESSGMYRGEDLVSVISPLMSGRLDARVGQPPAVAERHRGVVSASLQPQGAAGIVQLPRQPSC